MFADFATVLSLVPDLHAGHRRKVFFAADHRCQIRAVQSCVTKALLSKHERLRTPSSNSDLHLLICGSTQMAILIAFDTGIIFKVP